MEFTEISQCVKKLNFSPYTQTATHLPAYSWRGYLLTGFDKESGNCIKLNDDDQLSDVLFELYPHLSLIELSRFYVLAHQNLIDVDWSTLFFKYKIRYSDELDMLMQKINLLPEKFQKWCHDKSISAKDLFPLKMIDSTLSLDAHLVLLANANPTRSDGVKAIEYLVDLSLMKTDLPSLENSWAEYYKDLQRKRYPSDYNQNLEGQKLLKELPWPKKMEAKYLRRGDRSGFEIRFFVQSRNELATHLRGLHSVEAELENRSVERL